MNTAASTGAGLSVSLACTDILPPKRSRAQAHHGNRVGLESAPAAQPPRRLGLAIPLTVPSVQSWLLRSEQRIRASQQSRQRGRTP
jgi:hypothetical protein